MIQSYSILLVFSLMTPQHGQVLGFVPSGAASFVYRMGGARSSVAIGEHMKFHVQKRCAFMMTTSKTSSNTDDKEEEQDLDIEFLFHDDDTDIDSVNVEIEIDQDAEDKAMRRQQLLAYQNLGPQEKAWRHVPKPLLRIGSKGATHSHGNSLRQLLEDHTIVKVKVNTKKFGTLQRAYEVLRDLAVENGANPDMELIQMRQGSNEILFGLPGTLKKLQDGTFPPCPFPSIDDDDENDGETTTTPSVAP